jgi:hypothetical protein
MRSEGKMARESMKKKKYSPMIFQKFKNVNLSAKSL